MSVFEGTSSLKIRPLKLVSNDIYATINLWLNVAAPQRGFYDICSLDPEAMLTEAITKEQGSRFPQSRRSLCRHWHHHCATFFRTLLQYNQRLLNSIGLKPPFFCTGIEVFFSACRIQFNPDHDEHSRNSTCVV